IKAVRKTGKHAQGTIAYTTSPVHTIEMWVELAKEVADMGADSIAIKDMAGILKPYVAYDLVSRLKKELDIPIHMQCHATTGMSTATAIKAAEAGIDNVDTAISSMSMTYGHSPTEAVVAILEGTDRDTGLDLNLLEEIASYFRQVRKKYAKFEGSLRGTDSRILIAQVPGGMLTNMENQLREQNASDKFDQVLDEIPKVREDLGFIPLVTPTSQIVGTQAVLNVLTGERYKSISKETSAILKGEYGAAPAPMNKELQERVLDGKEPVTCRPADLLEPEMDKLTDELKKLADEKGIKLSDNVEDDVLTYALFPQIGLKFLENRDNPDAFEPVPTAESAAPAAKSEGPETYTVEVNGKKFVVAVSEGGEISQIQGEGGAASAPAASSAPAPAAGEGEPVVAPLGGNIFKVLVSPGDTVEEGDVMIILEAMKMETEVRAPKAGTIGEVFIKVGDAVSPDDEMLTIA
ncbi:MAG: pyruvate carboxylase subunit B, partial [Marinobacter adhaerens]